MAMFPLGMKFDQTISRCISTFEWRKFLVYLPASRTGHLKIDFLSTQMNRKFIFFPTAFYSAETFSTPMAVWLKRKTDPLHKPSADNGEIKGRRVWPDVNGPD